jgi:hypothetical protein
MAGKAKDDLEAVREIAELLDGFANDERERIIRWVREKLGMVVVPTHGAAPVTNPATSPGTPTTPTTPAAPSSATDMRTFVAQKKPKTDKQLAAVVAYYHRFVAPPEQRTESIGAQELINACRIADRGRPKSPAQTLVNAFHEGFLDRAERGAYRLNSVGENLVAMVLPDGESNGEGRRASAKRGTARKVRKGSKKKRPK